VEDEPAYGAGTATGSVGRSHRSGAGLLDMLVRAAGAAAARRGEARMPRAPVPPAVVRGGSSLFGCLRRLVLLAIVLFILAMVAFFMLFGQGGMFHRVSSLANVRWMGVRVDAHAHPAHPLRVMRSAPTAARAPDRS
jgi:hypothetical protein